MSGARFAQKKSLAQGQVFLPRVGDTATAYVRMHSFTSIASGTTLTVTYIYSSTRLSTTGTIEVGLTADESICGIEPTITVLPSATPTPTPMPSLAPLLYLPLILR
ncbi:MAG: hypothetical protein J7M05_10855 [Anaerolineae bacterium]|nr:hypothetical protein [Anaerolineae bacterium]